MIWHIVRFDMTELDESTRLSVEADLEGFATLDDVAWLRVARDVEEPQFTGLITGFVDHAALERYRVHPAHLPFVERARSLGIPTVRFDIATDDDPATLP